MERNVKLNTNAKNLRKNMTKEEAKLWYQFLCRYPYRFRRQYIIGNYITDFYCHQAKLVVELDGSQHCDPDEMEYDRKRTTYLHSQGLEVLRFSNLDVTRQFKCVCEAIDNAVKGRITCE
jgi:very-short-patch-repair endonuclease